MYIFSFSIPDKKLIKFKISNIILQICYKNINERLILKIQSSSKQQNVRMSGFVFPPGLNLLESKTKEIVSGGKEAAKADFLINIL